MEGLWLEGAEYVNNSLILSDLLRVALPPMYLTWKQHVESEMNSNLVLPLYGDYTRSTLVAELLLARPLGALNDVWAQRGVAVVLRPSSL
jgi:hypothetical protein